MYIGMHGGLSFGGVILWIIMLAVVLIPISRILHRAGHSRAWCLLLFVPFVNIVGLWAFAYTRWPGVEEKRAEVPEFH